MTCKDCKFFRYEISKEGALWCEDFYCVKHHEVLRDKDDFLPAYGCRDFVESATERGKS